MIVCTQCRLYGYDNTVAAIAAVCLPKQVVNLIIRFGPSVFSLDLCPNLLLIIAERMIGRLANVLGPMANTRDGRLKVSLSLSENVFQLEE